MRNEKIFPDLHGNNRIKITLRLKFKDSRSKFDKQLRKEKRKYEMGFVKQFDEINTNNPKLFWESLKRLGPKKHNVIPMKVRKNDGTETGNADEVKEFWKDEFTKVYNPVLNVDF